MKSGNLNFLEPSGPVQACNGTDLPFLHTVAFAEISESVVLKHDTEQNKTQHVIPLEILHPQDAPHYAAQHSTSRP